MAQVFTTTYKNTYKWKIQPKISLVNPDKTVSLDLNDIDDDNIWLVDQNAQLNEEINNINKINETIKNLALKRWRSTYRVSFCENLKLPSISSIDGELQTEATSPKNELLEYGRNLYEKEESKILPPIKTSRTIYGYIRPGRLRTKLTRYQDDYGNVGYKILKSAYVGKQ